MWAFIFALIAGVAVTAQAGSSSQLKQSLRDPIIALAANYLLGILCVALVILVSRSPLPEASRLSSAPWWAWAGGALGVLYGLSVVFLAHRMGAAPLIATVVTGQLVFSVVVDHFGWIGFEMHRANSLRLVGCGLILGGLVLLGRY